MTITKGRLVTLCVIACIVVTGATVMAPSGICADPKGDAPKKEKDGDTAKAISRYVFKSVAWIVIDPDAKEAARGTGTLIDRENRLLLTTYDLVYGSRAFVVIFPRIDKVGEVIREKKEYVAGVKDKDAIKGKVLAFDKTADLALIQLERVPDGVEALPLAKNELNVGDDLHIVGPAPKGDTLWVSAPGVMRKLHDKGWRLVTPDERVLSHDTRVIEADIPTKVSPSRGTPCVNNRGELVGIAAIVPKEDGEMLTSIAVSECDSFIKKVFEVVAELKGKTWKRPERPLLPKREK